ncbi:imidazole glycerol phosphate synthase subunit HisF [Exiguobacterium sp. Leaf187]|jgi:cyclase|uniref:Imidazole glycerol phosphate synthase subunit HisF n=4 Tax=Exiguobacterium TaxID=33986 RepID=A0A0V8GIW6_9BACL|nr:MULTISPECIES: imidazole glycerol phosphate synthase subunit HisF [Exiguobacterium]AHA30564.1 imidazole glycerol phosphate synthase [Exiguobacterium sp. MH3]AOT01532.1 imidazole glycerol phosphate synthase subunit HisF [Exiguobacterium sp. U13-1]EZP60347.1 Imidazole glycerol phosphate synthase subunit HisF [Exiguobacterium sp. RIT341]KNH32889.1 imidazole glycerol phosphate synthase [Exiguobacterium acetylicum]KQS19799.1 imidazole glycerol phosphate synthase subunit HisF [Exiguobacterium sp. 
MLMKRIIPCLDVKEGRVVKGVKFQNLRDLGDPVAVAKYYYEQGADELVLLDISATQEGRETMLDIVERVAEVIYMPFTVGGGIKTIEDAKRLIRAGADKVSLNSSALQNPQLIQEVSRLFGVQATVVAIDAKQTGDSWGVFSHGGTQPVGRDAIEWAQEAVALGAGELLVTSMDADGTKDGYDLALIRRLREVVNVPIIASGGVGTLDHLAEGLEAGADAALAASIFHEATYTMPETKAYLKERGVEVR